MSDLTADEAVCETRAIWNGNNSTNREYNIPCIPGNDDDQVTVTVTEVLTILLHSTTPPIFGSGHARLGWPSLPQLKQEMTPFDAPVVLAATSGHSFST